MSVFVFAVSFFVWWVGGGGGGIGWNSIQTNP